MNTAINGVSLALPGGVQPTRVVVQLQDLGVMSFIAPQHPANNPAMPAPMIVIDFCSSLIFAKGKVMFS